MKAPLLLAAATILALRPVPALALRDCDPPASDDLSRLGRWAAQVDTVSRRFLREAEPGDHATPFGTIIAKSCLEGELAPRRSGTIAMLEAQLGETMRRAYRCEKLLKLGFAGNAFSVLRMARIECVDDVEAHADADNDLFRYKPGAAPLTQANSGYDRSYRFNLSKRKLLAGEYRSVRAFVIDDEPREQIGTPHVLFHEALHSSGADNRSWHSDREQVRKRLKANRCDKSIFEDRVFLVTALCYAQESESDKLWGSPGGILDCPGVCERGLSTRDAGLPEQARSTGAITGLVGPPLSAPFSAGNASWTCKRARAMKRSWNQLRGERKSLEAKANRIGMSDPDPKSLPAGLRESIRTLWENAWNRLSAVYRAEAPVSQAKTAIGAARAEIQAYLRANCAGTEPANRPRASACNQYAAPYLAELERYAGLVAGFESRDRTAASAGLPSSEQLLEFFN